jgi:hypothetical protein
MSDNESPFEDTIVEGPEQEVEGDDGALDDLDVEALESVDGENAVDEDVETLPEGATAETPAAPVKPKKAAVASGYITPVAFAHLLTEREQKAGRISAAEAIAPQVIYSYVNQGKKPGADPAKTLKSYSVGGRENLLKADEAFTFWDDKDARVQARKAAKVAKLAAAAEAAKAAPATPVVEAEAAEPVTEVE